MMNVFLEAMQTGISIFLYWLLKSCKFASKYLYRTTSIDFKACTRFYASKCLWIIQDKRHVNWFNIFYFSLHILNSTLRRVHIQWIECFTWNIIEKRMPFFYLFINEIWSVIISTIFQIAIWEVLISNFKTWKQKLIKKIP